MRDINFVELLFKEDGAFNQPCKWGNLIAGHSVYCHNSDWDAAPRKCRRTWYTGGEARDEDCKGFGANEILTVPKMKKPLISFDSPPEYPTYCEAIDCVHFCLVNGCLDRKEERECAEEAEARGGTIKELIRAAGNKEAHKESLR